MLLARLNNTTPTEPFFFLKPTTCYAADKEPVECPKGVTLHHEVELGVVIGTGGRDITEKDALKHIAGYTLAIDYTGRNMQDAVKKKGLPWSAAKGFDTWWCVSMSLSGSSTASSHLCFAHSPVSRFIDASEIKNPHDLNLWYKVRSLSLQSSSSHADRSSAGQRRDPSRRFNQLDALPDPSSDPTLLFHHAS